MKTTTTTKKISHAKFWGLLKQQENYSEAYKAELKASWVMSYSGSKTTSLNELYQVSKNQYNKMLKDMSYMPSMEQRDRQNRQRRKLLALVYEFCKHKHYTCTKEQAIHIACKACGVNTLNKASEHALIAAIKSFEKNEAAAWVDSVLNKVTNN